MSVPRGIQNNNPGNVRRSRIVWQGQSELQTDPEFVQFTSPQWGFRCMARILKNHYAEGQQSVRALISIWAPPEENDTEAYIANVANWCQVTPDQVLTFPDDLQNLLTAICRQENGECPYEPEVIEEGIALEAYTR